MSFSSRRIRTQTFRGKAKNEIQEGLQDLIEPQALKLSNTRKILLHDELKEEDDAKKNITMRKANPTAKLNIEVKSAAYGSARYTERDLMELRMNQETKSSFSTKETDDVDLSLADEARKIREKKRATAQKAESSKELFISLSDSRKRNEIGKVTKESRLITEDQDDDDISYNDYGSKIPFAQSYDSVKDQIRSDIKSTLENEPVDPSWENVQMNKGARIPVYNEKVMENKYIVNSIPDANFIPPPSDELFKLEEKIKELELFSVERVSTTEQLRIDKSRAESILEDMKSNIDIFSKKYDFFQLLDIFAVDLSEFIANKLPEIEHLQLLWEENLKALVRENERVRNIIMRTCYAFFVPSSKVDIEVDFDSILGGQKQALLNAKLIESLETEMEHTIEKSIVIFEDCDEKFRSLSQVNKILSQWSLDYPETYELAHGKYCIPEIWKIFVKYELLGYTYDMKFEMERMNWVLELTDNFPCTDESIIPNIIESVVAPWFQTQMEYWDAYNTPQTEFLSGVLLQISGFSPAAKINRTLKSLVVSKILEMMDVEMKKYAISIETLLRPLNEVSLKAADTWLGEIQILKDNICIWKNSIDHGVINSIIKDKFLEQLVPKDCILSASSPLYPLSDKYKSLVLV